MALVSVGGITVASTGAQPQVDTFGNLKKCVARVLNAENQPDVLEAAGYGIQSGINDVNLKHLFRFGRKSATDETLVSGTQAYDLESDFFAVSEVQLVDSDSDPYSTLQYMPWQQFNDLVPAQDQDGIPIYWTSKNTFDDGEILLYPVPDASAAADYTLRITYFERVDMVTADGDIIDAPRELGDVICWYGKYWLLFHRAPEKVAAWREAKSMYDEKLEAFVGLDRREPTANLQFSLGRATDEPNTTTYIKVQ